MFWSTARGKVGDVVFCTVKGQTITRKYQPLPTNPRTDAQQLQRAKFSNAVKFFKHAQQAYFKFAYEDRKKTESDYNAFMRYNATAAMLPTRSQYLGYFPSISKGYMLSAGSLPSIDLASEGSGEMFYYVGGTDWAENPTMGNLSAAMIARYGLQYGDIITLLSIDCPDTYEITDEPQSYPVWRLAQFRIDADSTQLVDDALSGTMWSLGTHDTDSGVIKVDSKKGSLMSGIVVSRVTTSGTKVSNTYLDLDVKLAEIYDNSLSASWQTTALASWAASGAAVLQGSLSE